MGTDQGRPSGTTLAAFMGAVVIGGANFLAVKFSNEELDPLSGAAMRFIAATILIALISLVWRYDWPRGRAATGAAIYGLLGFGVSYAFLYYAILGLGAGPTSIIIAAVPLATLILAVAHRQEVITARGIIGGGLAVAGIGVLSLRSLDADLELSYIGAAILGVLAIAESGVVIKGFPRAHPMTTNAVGMGVGAIFLVIVSLVYGQSWALPTEARTWAALAWLVLLGSAGLFYLFLYVISRWTASATSYVTTLMPVVAVTLGALFADEVITIEVVIGGALVLIAVYIGVSGSLQQEAEVQPSDVGPVEALPSEAR